MYSKKMKQQKGITLIALVITIIVLLILAGVTISLTLGERDIFNTAEKAAENYKTAQESELASLNNSEDEINSTINSLGINTSGKQAVTKIEVTPATSELKVGENVTLTANVQPSNAFNPAYTWSSSDDKVAIVDQEGNVTAIAAGTATIYATANDGSGVTGTASVTINDSYPAYTVGQTISLGGVSYYVMADSGVTEDKVTLLRVTPYGSYIWSQACIVGTNYASSLGYTSEQATSHLITEPEVRALSSSMGATGSPYWTSTACNSNYSWVVNYKRQITCQRNRYQSG